MQVCGWHIVDPSLKNVIIIIIIIVIIVNIIIIIIIIIITNLVPFNAKTETLKLNQRWLQLD